MVGDFNYSSTNFFPKKTYRWSTYGQNMKRNLTSLIISEMQIKTAMRQHLTSARMAIIKKVGSDKYWRGCGRRRLRMHCCQKCQLVQQLWKKIQRFLKKLKIRLPYNLAILLLGVYLKKMKTILKTTCSLFISIVAFFTIAKLWNSISVL